MDDVNDGRNVDVGRDDRDGNDGREDDDNFCDKDKGGTNADELLMIVISNSSGASNRQDGFVMIQLCYF